MKNKFVRNTIILTVIGLACVLIPSGLITLKSFFYDLPIGIDAYWAQVITLAGVNAIMALSVNVVCGITGQLSLGQAGFQAIGAYAVILLTQNLHLPLPVSIILAGLIAAFFGFLIGFPTLKLVACYFTLTRLINSSLTDDNPNKNPKKHTLKHLQTLIKIQARNKSFNKIHTS